MKRIVIAGGGFGGLWSAVGAARRLDEAGVGSDQVRVTLVDRNDFHSIRVRNYEQDLEDTVIPLSRILDPIGVEHVRGEVVDIDLAGRALRVGTGNGATTDLAYDRLVYALGSSLLRPPIPGLAEHAFDVDTYDAAKRLARHLENLAQAPAREGRYTALVVGAGLTGIEIACELPERLAGLAAGSGAEASARVILADASPHIGSDMGEQARAVIAQALTDLGVRTLTDIRVAAVDEQGVTLADGSRIAASTVIWCAGMRAHELGRVFPVERDGLGRIPVDEFMRVAGVPGVFAAGDAAWAMVSDGRKSVMSCQHGRPMGRYAGHNVAADLLGEPLLPLHIDWYTTVLDLGPWGAVYTNGWDRRVVSTREAAKRTKQTINQQRIYPPRSGNREEILAAAAPQVQQPPATVAMGTTAY